jgi:hypothetical protein
MEPAAQGPGVRRMRQNTLGRFTAAWLPFVASLSESFKLGE